MRSFFGGLEQSLVLELLHIFILSNTSVRYKKHNKIHCISFRTLLNYFLVDTKISAEYTKGVVLKMSKLSLAGEWKLRGEFMDVTADRCAEVLVHLNAMPPKPTIPGYLTEENMTEEEREKYLKEPDPKFTVNTALAMHPYPSKTGYIPMTVPGDVTTALIDNGIIEEPF